MAMQYWHRRLERSTGNANGKIGIDNNNVVLSLKGVLDVLTVTIQAGIQHLFVVFFYEMKKFEKNKQKE